MKENQPRRFTNTKKNPKQTNIRVRLFKSIVNEPEERTQLTNMSISTLCQKITEQNGEIKQLKSIIQQKETEYNEMKQILTSQIKRISQNKVRKLSESINYSQSKLTEKEHDKSTTYHNEISGGKSTQIISKQQGQISVFRGILISMKQKQSFWETENAKLNSKLSTIEHRLKQAQQELISVKKINSRLTEDCASFQHLYYQQKKETQLLEQQLNNLLQEEAIQMKELVARENQMREESQKIGKEPIKWRAKDEGEKRRRPSISEILIE